jgi:hypothetical protein
MSQEYIYTITTGDWSNDGHNQYDDFQFKVNHHVDKIRSAYKKAQKKLKVAFDCNEKGKYRLCEEYEDDSISSETMEYLRTSGVNLDIFQNEPNDEGTQPVDPEGICKLFFEVVKTELPDLVYEPMKKPESINGFWNEDLNIGIGYGCYH